MSTVRVFNYIEQLDAFVATDQYHDLAERLGLIEWNPVVWVGRLFTLDNDDGGALVRQCRPGRADCSDRGESHEIHLSVKDALILPHLQLLYHLFCSRKNKHIQTERRDGERHEREEVLAEKS